MGRLIDIGNIAALPDALTLQTGDALMFAASGGYVRTGSEVMEMIGPFLVGVLGPTGEVLSPAGPPNSILFVARQRGEASIAVVTGDPFYAPTTTTLAVHVDE
jgi:hypothetical protein